MSEIDLKILIVDDSDIEMDMYKLIFPLEGFEVVSASNKDEAVMQALLQKPNIILLDFHLGDYTGFDVIKELRSHKSLQDIPVVFISGTRDEENVRHGHFLGSIDFLAKQPNLKSIAKYIKELAIYESIGSSLRRIEQILDRRIAAQ